MSWSFSCLGRPEAVAAAIDGHGETLTGQSRVEFDDARPYLIGLVRQNFVTPAAMESGHREPLIDFEASGSGSTRISPAPGVGAEQTQRQCTVSIKPVWKSLV